MIRLFDTKATEDEIALANDVLRSGSLVMGRHVEDLEDELETYLGGGGVATCASGTDALVLALETLGCGGAVIVPALTFSATYEAVLKAGCIPVVCDVDPETLTPSSLQINQCIIETIDQRRKHVDAVILVHLYGNPFYDLEVINLCRALDIAVIEDCAQCFGASLGRKKLGTFGDAAAFSFYPTKPLGGIGDGGAVYFSEPGLAANARARRNHGRDGDGVQSLAGYNSRLDEVNAAILRSRLLEHGRRHEHRLTLAHRYEERLTNFGGHHIKYRGNRYPYVFPVLLVERERVRSHLADLGIETRVHYHPPVSGLPYVLADCPNAAEAARHVLSLPCHEKLTIEDVDMICDALR